MNTKTGSHGVSKFALLNGLSLITKSSRMMLLAMILAVAILFGSSGVASASSTNGTNTGTSCSWLNANGIWIGYCYKAVTNTTGYIWIYNGSWQSPWLIGGIYDATYDYLSNFSGVYFQRTERATGIVTYPSSCGWIYANTTCSAGTSNNYAIVGGNAPTNFQIVGGNYYPSSPIYATVGGATAPTNPLTAYALSRVIDRWLVPTCDARYYYC